MGKILSMLLKEDCCTAQQKYELFFDFENVQPTALELELFDDVQIVLTEASDVLSDLKNYSGAEQHIRAAINNPSAEQTASTWEELIPRIRKLRRFYFFSQKIAYVVPLILTSIFSEEVNPSTQLECRQAIVKQFSQIIDFVFKFDEYKMQTPAIQNDFSYYRRVLMRAAQTSYSTDEDDDSSENMNIANKVSLFYAESTPMLRTLTNVTTQFLDRDKRFVHYASEMLSTMIKVCVCMLETPTAAQLQKRENHQFMFRLLVGLIILCDHVYPNGVFVKTSNIDIKGCIRLLKEQPEDIHTENLLNALRYTTVHLNDPSTSKSIKTLLMEA